MSESLQLPHRRMIVYERALQLLAAVQAAQVADLKLRDQALRAAKSVCLNIAEGAARFTMADKARAFVIARGEAAEAAAAIEVGAQSGDTGVQHSESVNALANEIYAMLTALIMRFRPLS